MNHQNDINYKMRQILVDWIISVCIAYSVSDEILHLSVAILDNYLSLCQVTRKQLQCVGITAFYIACKLDEEIIPSLQDIAWICTNVYTTKEIAEMENTILSKLDYNVMLDTMKNYLSCKHSSRELNFLFDSILLNKDILYGYDVDELIESCVEASTNTGNYWSFCVTEILNHRKSIKITNFPELMKKYKYV
tara:strand:+ start:605 stop:1180 length:576 start_codon:yes stop_codon:yes gene_type:complete